MTQDNGIRLAIDIGRTFTDTVLMEHGSRVLATTKTQTTPDGPALGALDGARTVLKDQGATGHRLRPLFTIQRWPPTP